MKDQHTYSRFILFIISILFLSACHADNREMSYDYLLLHPGKLKSEIVRCQNLATASGEISKYCNVVFKAADHMMSLAEDQQQHPEKFGQKILQAQMEYAQTPTPQNQDQVRILLLIVGLSSPE